MSKTPDQLPSPKGTGTIVDVGGAAHARIWGVGGYRPDRIVPNSEIVERLDSTDEWIRERSGIRQRRIAADHESVTSMSVWAAEQAIERAGIEAEQIDAVLVATVTHPLQTPGAAPIIADQLGLRCAAFDISAACAGYCHGIALANDMVRGGSSRFVLVIGVEKLSDFTDVEDRGTAFIFADGAGAAIVGPSDVPGIGKTIWGSDGSKWETIRQTRSWTQIRDEGGGHPSFAMAGQSVFRWAVWSMAPVARAAMEAAGIRAEDLDAFIPHQANERIIDAMIKQLKLPADIPVARDIADTANTSSASIPLATERMLREGQIPSGGLALQIGFGAGLVYAGQVVVLP
ncbi:MAG: beta-ketoacyl-ACP synthase III [Dermatophilaceae bacterium]